MNDPGEVLRLVLSAPHCVASAEQCRSEAYFALRSWATKAREAGERRYFAE